MKKTTDKLLAVESVRGIACFMVVLSHLSLAFFPYLHSFGITDRTGYSVQNFFHQSPFAFFFSGTSAVFIFFVLSGFILTKVALNRGGSSYKILRMSLKRYPRLMIPALVSCLIAYLTFVFMPVSSEDLGYWVNHYGNFDYSLSGAIYSATIESFFLSTESQYNHVLWTMRVELLGSFFIYLLCINSITLKYSLLPSIMFAVLVLLTGSKMIGSDLGLGLISFYAGYTFCIYGKRIPTLLSVLLLLIGLYLAGAHNGSASYALVYGVLGDDMYKICNSLSGFFIVYAILFNEKLNAIFSGKATVFMGKVSFSVYLLHIPILSTLGIYSFNVFLGRFGLYDIAAIGASIITIVASYLCAIVFYKHVDLRGMLISNTIAEGILRGVAKCGRSMQKVSH